MTTCSHVSSQACTPQSITYISGTISGCLCHLTVHSFSKHTSSMAVWSFHYISIYSLGCGASCDSSDVLVSTGLSSPLYETLNLVVTLCRSQAAIDSRDFEPEVYTNALTLVHISTLAQTLTLVQIIVMQGSKFGTYNHIGFACQHRHKAQLT